MRNNMEVSKRPKSWEVTNPLWQRVEPLLPVHLPSFRRWRKGRKPGGGRPRLPDRQVFEGIIYVLRTGCQWQAVPRQFGSGATIHRRFQEWERAGVWRRFWAAGLAEYDELKGIAWRWQSADGAMNKSPLGGEATGPNPTDRGKKRSEAEPVGRRAWGPAFPRRDRGKHA